MTYGQAGAVCPQCGSAAAVHSVDELAAMARARLGQFGLGYQGPPPGYQPPRDIRGRRPDTSRRRGLPRRLLRRAFPRHRLGFPSAPLSSDLPPAAPATTAAGLLGLGAAAGLQRAEASQPVVQGQLDEQLVEQQ